MKKDIIVAKDKKHLKKLINECIKEEGYQCDLNHIDTSLITDMCSLFESTKFDGDISNWNVSQVTDMSFLFYNSAFNGDISNWNAINAQYISGILLDCSMKIIPYWLKIEDYEERKKAVLEYQETLENKKLLEKLIKNQSSTNVIHKI